MPGERIAFSGSIDNKSNDQVETVTVSVMQDITFHSTEKSKTCRRLVSSMRLPLVVASKSFQSFKDSIIIPAVCQSWNGTCRIIVVQYLISMELSTGTFSTNTEIPIPITIGTIPLWDAARTDTAPSAPPSYEACMFGPNPDNTEIKGDIIESDAQTFAPSYPVYKDFSII